jgi:hypothetical protein
MIRSDQTLIRGRSGESGLDRQWQLLCGPRSRLEQEHGNLPHCDS